MPVTKRDGMTGTGVVLAYDAAGGTNFTAVPRVVSMDGLEDGDPELIDAGHLGDTDRVKRVVCGEDEPSVVEVETIYKKDAFLTLSAIRKSETVNWRVTFPEPTSPLTRTFPGILTKIPTGPFERGGLILMKLSIRVNGPITNS